MDGTEEDEAARDKRAQGIAAIERAAAKASAARANEEKDDARPLPHGAAGGGVFGKGAADADAAEWACSVCTVLNVPSFLACSVCGSERRDVAAAAVVV